VVAVISVCFLIIKLYLLEVIENILTWFLDKISEPNVVIDKEKPVTKNVEIAKADTSDSRKDRVSSNKIETVKGKLDNKVSTIKDKIE
jgi:hypothetical protein